MALSAEQARHTERMFHIALRRCETLWSAREIASVTLSAEQHRHTENVFRHSGVHAESEQYTI